MFHLASNTIKDHKPGEIHKIINTNIKFSTFLLEAMTNYQCKYLINIGSYWQFNTKKNQSPINIYAATKSAFFSLIDYYVNNRNLTTFSLILYDIYGEKDNRKKIFQKIIDHSNRNKKIYFTSGEQNIILIHINDVINAFYKSLNLIKLNKFRNLHKIFYLKSKSYKLKNIIMLFAKHKFIDSKNFIWSREKSNKIIYKPHTGQKLPNWNAKITINKMFKIS